ncbi:component of SufBCD complex [Acidimangrovimonas sediminis]|uniref:component of SufBCD complex n=1 Tax=Acidimangrovimonas sediminis TaxID=2056283 RepID=UPI000C808941|nr:component of SufBCD complex [Acidimangrovimonas sediminis]
MHPTFPFTELIDFRSFSNLWYWIALAVLWSTSSHWVLGVPYDMIMRAKRHGGQAQRDLETMVRINVARILHIARVAGIWLIGVTAFALTTLAVLGFGYRIEFAQALLLLAGPMAIVGALSIRNAARIEAGESEGEALQRRLHRHRLAVQALGIVAIFVTAMWGMYQNISLGVLIR